MELKGSAALVTGASHGIGLSISEALIGRGARVAGLARSEEPLREAAGRLGKSFLPIPGDVRDLESVAAAVRRADEAFGGIDILVNNAGIGRFAPIDRLAKEDWDEMMETNVTGIYHVTREAVPVMKRRKSGHIINIASIAGLIGNPELSGYNASKFAVRGLSEALFKELREFGIKVTAVFPGSVETGFARGRPPSATTNKMLPDEIAEVVIHVLERSRNFLISEVVMRPLNPKG